MLWLERAGLSLWLRGVVSIIVRIEVEDVVKLLTDTLVVAALPVHFATAATHIEHVDGGEGRQRVDSLDLVWTNGEVMLYEKLL